MHNRKSVTQSNDSKRRSKKTPAKTDPLGTHQRAGRSALAPPEPAHARRDRRTEELAAKGDDHDANNPGPDNARVEEGQVGPQARGGAVPTNRACVPTSGINSQPFRRAGEQEREERRNSQVEGDEDAGDEVFDPLSEMVTEGTRDDQPDEKT